MKGHNLVSLSLAAAIVWTATGCKVFEKSKVRSLESDDWMRDGVDRFYIAVAPQGIPMEGAKTGAQVGQEVLFGIGCFGEPKERNALVDVPPDPCGGGATKLALSERYMIHQFPLADDPAKAKKGDCVVLMGDEDMLAHMQLFPKDFQAGPGAEAIASSFATVGVAGMSTALMTTPLLRTMVASPVGAAWSRTIYNVAGKSLRSTSWVNRGLVQAQLLAMHGVRPKSMPISALKSAKLTVGRNIGRFSRFLTGNPATSARAGVPAGAVPWKAAGKWGVIGVAGTLGAVSVWSLVTRGQRSKNRIAFFKGMQDADKLAGDAMQASPSGATFKQLVVAGNLREAAAFYNPTFAQQFNKNVHGTFEQGWAAFGQRPVKFFETIREIQGELQVAAGQSVQTGRVPDAGFGERSAADAAPGEAEAASAAAVPQKALEPDANIQPERP